MDFEISLKIEVLEKAISTEESQIRRSKVVALAVAGLALIVAVLVLVLTGPLLSEKFKFVLCLCSVPITGAGAAFPVKDISSKRNRITWLTYLRDRYHRVLHSGVSAKQLEELEMDIKRFSDLKIY